MPRKKKPERKNWIVKIRREVIVEIYCRNCTEDEAYDSPHRFSCEEHELEYYDSEVLSVKEDQ